MSMARVLLVLVDLALVVVALIDCLSVEEHEIRALPRFAWVLLILLFSPIGPIAWFVAGRPRRVVAGAATDPLLSPPPPKRVLAPDDDPEFLGKMSARNRREDEELLRMWEADLRKREEELRRRDRDETDDPPSGQHG
jgi:hypothetical protein